ncbi:hypothetical protein BC835DRAFT_1304298 [Cytidiella melzeri]|nr:hypothetical protein BC835DRAFT_1304298 [Cytidiella melzeri]
MPCTWLSSAVTLDPMSNCNERPAEVDKVTVVLELLAELTRVVHKASTAQTGKKNCKLDKKESKNKLFTLTLDNNKDSYVQLLQTILGQHGKPLYKYLPARAAKKDALDVETLKEYMDMIVQLDWNRTSKVTIYAQFEDIKKTVRHQSNTNMSSDSKSLDGDKVDESDNEWPNTHSSGGYGFSRVCAC